MSQTKAKKTKDKVQKTQFDKSAFTLSRIIARLFASWFGGVLTVLAVNGNQPDSFDVLAYAQTDLAVVICIAVILFAALSLLAVKLTKFNTDSWGLFVFSTVCVLVWICNYSGGNEVMFMIALTVVYWLIIYYCLNENIELLGKFQPSKRVVLIFTIVCGVLSCLMISLITCLRYKTFNSPNYDFGLFVNMFHHMKTEGLPLSTSERDKLLSHFAVHISPIFYVLLPFYFVFTSPLTLQIGQAVLVASGIIPVYLMARKFKLSGKVTALITFIYAFYPALTTSNFYDLHENCFLPCLLLWVFCFYERKQYIPMYIFVALTLLVKEDAAIYVIVFGIFLLLSEKNFKHGAIVVGTSIAWFLIATWLLRTYGTGVMDNSRFGNLILNDEDGLFGAIKTVLVNPGYVFTQLFTGDADHLYGKIIYALEMFVPLGFIPFCTKKASRWLLVTPILINLVTMYQYQFQIGFQYHYAISAFLIYALLKNVNEISLPKTRTLLTFGAAACMIFYVILVLPEFKYYQIKWHDNSKTYERMEEILDSLPEDASLNVSSKFIAHVADRDTVYEINYHDNKPDVDFLVCDMTRDCSEAIEAYEEAGYTLCFEEPGLISIWEK